MNNSTLQAKQWYMLCIYNIYRLLSIGVLALVFWFDNQQQVHALFYFVCLAGYLLFGFLFFYLWYQKSPHFEQQVLCSGTVDIIVVVLLIHQLGYIHTGLGVLLYAFIAVLSILTPGRFAIFFASVASCLLLVLSASEYIGEQRQDLNVFFSTGIYGAGFFATALTAWYLANWVRSSERIVQDKTKELANIHRLNEYIVERLQYGVIYIDKDETIKVINTAARNFFNIKIGHNKLILKQISSVLYEKYSAFLAKKREATESAQAVIETPYLQVHFFSATHDIKTAVLIILEDMTYITQQAQQLKLASLGQFSASIAHELRNPLGVIAHASQLLGEKQYLTPEDERLKALIINNCARMDKVIKNTLQLSRRQQSFSENIALAPFLKQFKQSFCLINKCKMELHLPQKPRLYLHFDKSQLEQILVILCDNAIQHGQDKKGRVSIYINVEATNRGLLLSVCDKGPGILKVHRGQIFDPFFTTLRTGTGMGLFIAKELCEMNQANLEFREMSQGSCFIIHCHNGDEIRL